MTGKSRVGLFIVGAPKCGTTALFKYLGEHPGVYVPDFLYGNAGKTEANHFAPEFLDSASPMRDRTHYLSFYEGAEPNEILCDASVFHLYSASAPARIFDYNPDAKIIIMVRHPVDFLFSYFQEVRFQGLENESDFGSALQLEEQRAQDPSTSPLLSYRHFAHFSDYIARYLDVFPRNQVLFIKAENFFRDMPAVYSEVLRFIGAEPWRPEAFSRVNPSKSARFKWLQQALHHPPKPLVSLIKRVLGEERSMVLAKQAVKLNRHLNTTQNKNVMDPRLSRALRDEFRPEVKSLRALTGLDLSDWLADM